MIKLHLKSFLSAMVVSAAIGPTLPRDASAQVINVPSSNASYQSRRTFGGGLYDAVSNKTYIAFSGPAMDLYVQSFNHATSAWETPVRVSAYNQSGAFDYHDYVTLVMLPNGRLALFQVDHTMRSFIIKAPNPNSLSGTWTRQQINSDRNCYPMPVVVGSRVYFFYSKDDDQSYPYRTYRFVRSDDNGSTWSAPRTVIDSGKTTDKFNEVYAFGVFAREGRIYISYTMAGGPSGHNIQARNLYANYVDTANDQVYSMTGQNLGNVVNSTDLSASLIKTATPKATESYGDKHPIENSQIVISSTGQAFIGFQETEDSIAKVKLGKLSNGAWSFQTVINNALFWDITRSGTSDYEMLYSPTDHTRLRSVRVINGGPTTQAVFDLAISGFGTNADVMSHVNFVENRSSIRAIGSMHNVATRTTNYTGDWPVITVRQ